MTRTLTETKQDLIIAFLGAPHLAALSESDKERKADLVIKLVAQLMQDHINCQHIGPVEQAALNSYAAGFIEGTKARGNGIDLQRLHSSIDREISSSAMRWMHRDPKFDDTKRLQFIAAMNKKLNALELPAPLAQVAAAGAAVQGVASPAVASSGRSAGNP
jgi:hypothetical protein